MTLGALVLDLREGWLHPPVGRFPSKPMMIAPDTQSINNVARRRSPVLCAKRVR
jgi:hypothetical protein